MSSPSATTLAAGEGYATATSLGVGEGEGGVGKGCATATSGGGGGGTSTTLTSLGTFGTLPKKQSHNVSQFAHRSSQTSRKDARTCAQFPKSRQSIYLPAAASSNSMMSRSLFFALNFSCHKR